MFALHMPFRCPNVSLQKLPEEWLLSVLEEINAVILRLNSVPQDECWNSFLHTGIMLSCRIIAGGFVCFCFDNNPTP